MGARGKPKMLDSEQLWNYALKALAGRAHSLHELRQKLLRRAERAADVPLTLAKLQEYGLADDRKFSDSLASARLENQGFGSQRVLRELRAKQVPDRVASEAVAQTYSGTAEHDLIDAFLARKYRNKNLPELLRDPKQLASAYRRLRTAGFSSSASLAALKRYASSVEEWEEPSEEDE
jgi:regulatory protein